MVNMKEHGNNIVCHPKYLHVLLLSFLHGSFVLSPGHGTVITATATQPQRNVLKYFAIFKNVAHSLEPGETPSYSASHQAQSYVQSY